MTRKRKVSELVEFDASEFLNSDEDVAAYLTAVLEENDQALLAAALVLRQPRRAGIGPGGPLVGGCRGTAVDQPTFEKAGHSAGDCVAAWRPAQVGFPATGVFRAANVANPSINHSHKRSCVWWLEGRRSGKYEIR